MEEVENVKSSPSIFWKSRICFAYVERLIYFLFIFYLFFIILLHQSRIFYITCSLLDTLNQCLWSMIWNWASRNIRKYPHRIWKLSLWLSDWWIKSNSTLTSKDKCFVSRFTTSTPYALFLQPLVGGRKETSQFLIK